MAGTIRAENDHAPVGLAAGIDQIDAVMAELVVLGERIERQQQRIWAELGRLALAAPPRVVNVRICPGPIEPPKRRGWTVAG